MLALTACGGDTTNTQAVAPTGTAPVPATIPQQTASAPGSAPPAATTATPPSTTIAQPEPRTTPQRRPARTRAHRPTQTQATATQPTPAPSPSPATAPQEPEPQPAAMPIEELAVLTLVERRGPTHYFQRGTLTGTFDGTIVLEARVVARGVVVYFTATVDGGTITGKGVAIPTIGGSATARLDGTAKVTGGTGRFASIRGRRLVVSGTTRLDASRARVRLTGTVTL